MSCPIYQIREAKGEPLEFQIALVDDDEDDEPEELVCSLWAHPTGLTQRTSLQLNKWDTCSELRWAQPSDKKRRGTYAIIRWHDRDYSGEVLDVFGWAKKDPETQDVTVTMAPVLEPEKKSYAAPSMDEDRFPPQVSPAQDQRIKQIILLRAYHEKNDDGFLYKVFRSALLRERMKRGMLRPFTFRYKWPRTPRRSPTKADNRRKTHGGANTRKRKKTSPSGTPGKRSTRRCLAATDLTRTPTRFQFRRRAKKEEQTSRNSSPAPLDPSVQQVINEFGINEDQVEKVCSLNLNRSALWKFVDNESELVSGGLPVPVARALLARLAPTPAQEPPQPPAQEPAQEPVPVPLAMPAPTFSDEELDGLPLCDSLSIPADDQIYQAGTTLVRI